MLNQRDPVDEVFHALGDPTRRRIVEHLSHGSASVSELARPLAISLPGVVQHLQVLEASGLVSSEKIGRVRRCSMRPAAMREAEGWIAGRRDEWERRLDRLGAYLAEHPNARTERRAIPTPDAGIERRPAMTPSQRKEKG
jgi:DNA-binding transcriptional ArsR family regulator